MYLNALICIFQIYLPREIPHLHDTTKPSILKSSYFTHWFNCLRLNIGLDPPPHLFGVVQSDDCRKNWFSGSRLDVTISTAFFLIILISTSEISVFYWDNLISFGSKFWNSTCKHLSWILLLDSECFDLRKPFPKCLWKILAFTKWEMGLIYWNKILILNCIVEILVIQSHFVYLIFENRNLICNHMTILFKHASTRCS